MPDTDTSQDTVITHDETWKLETKSRQDMTEPTPRHEKPRLETVSRQIMCFETPSLLAFIIAATSGTHWLLSRPQHRLRSDFS